VWLKLNANLFFWLKTGRGAEEIGQLLFLGRLETSLDPPLGAPLNRISAELSVNCWVKKYKSCFVAPGILGIS
jgi:hypothetical protein